MNWENIDTDFEEEKEPDQPLNQQQNESEIQSLLQKFQDPTNDPERQQYLCLLGTFNDLLVAGATEQIGNTLIDEDAQLFLFSSTKGLPIQYSIGPKGFVELYKERRIVEREVRLTFVDKEKCATIQVCSCKIEYEDDEKLAEEFSVEVFSIQDNKIVKYRGSYASLAPAHNGEDPFVFKKKDKMLAKVKRINYALAGQPDLEKVASLLHETTEYTVLSWETDTLHTFRKDNFVPEFKRLENKFSIKYVIPYELYTETQETKNGQTLIVIGTYAYYLEEKAAGKLYVWLSTCAYAFDENINIIKVSQQGELYPENEITIPFEFYTREKIVNRVHGFFQNLKPNLDLFYGEFMNYDCKLCRLGPHDIPITKNFYGLDEIREILESLVPPHSNMVKITPVDIFVDLNDGSYDVAIGILAAEGTMFYEGYKYQNQHMNFVNIVIIAFENGKAAKYVQVFSEVPYPVPSPYDDESFSSINFKKRKDLKNLQTSSM